MRGADCLQCRLLEGMERGMLGETVQHFFFQKKKSIHRNWRVHAKVICRAGAGVSTQSTRKEM